MKNLLALLLIALLGFTTACESSGSEAEGAEDNTSTAYDQEMANSDTAAQAAAAQGQPADVTTVSFPEGKAHDFGTIQMGEVVSHKFVFENTGQHPLIIRNVKPSCGCTTPDYTKDPVPPGESGFVVLEYDTKKGKPGVVNKSATITANLGQPEQLRFKAEVKE